MLSIHTTMVHASVFCSAKNGMASLIFRSFRYLIYYHRRALSNDEKKCYIDAVKCLQSRPAHSTSRPASWTRFDEFQATHIELTVKIHFVVSVLAEASGSLPT